MLLRSKPVSIALGLDIGATKILAVAINDDGSVINEFEVKSSNSPRRLFDSLEDATVTLNESLGPRSEELVGIGVGVPGQIDIQGVLYETANLPAVSGAPVVSELARRFDRALWRRQGFRLVVDNDGMCSAAGEIAFGAARGLSDAIVITLGSGIGGGIIAGGRLLHGGRGFAGEIGHMVVDVDGPLCGCGRLGCWEKFVNGSGQARLAREAIAAGRATRIVELAGGQVEAVRSEHIFQAARAGDLEAWGIVDTIARYLALGIANLVEVLDPLAVIVGGGISRDGDLFMPLTEQYFAKTRRGSGEQVVSLRCGDLGNRSGAIGAATLSLGLVA
jgi:glucokinase